MKHQLIFIIVSLLRVKGHEAMRLSEPITVRLSPHQWPLEIWGLRVSPKKELYLMTLADGHGYEVEQWDRLDETDLNAAVMIATTYQRIKSLFKQAA